MAYTKLFQTIITSTIWMEDDRTRIIWITMLAVADKNGEVSGTIPGIARIAGVEIPDVERALKKFESPDPYSRTPDNEGRRIAKIEGGWLLLNYEKYRQMASKEDQKAKNAERQRRHRERRGSNDKKSECNEKPLRGHGTVTQGRDIAEAEASAKAEAKADAEDGSAIKTNSKPLTGSYTACEIDLPNGLDEVVEYFNQFGCPRWVAEDWYDSMESAGWQIRGTQIRKWRHFAVKKIRWWEAEGKPKTRASKAQPDGERNGKPLNQTKTTDELKAMEDSRNHNAWVAWLALDPMAQAVTEKPKGERPKGL